MVLIPVLCPHCHSDQVIKGGTTNKWPCLSLCLQETALTARGVYT
jgi:hypothetical protein